MASQLHLWILRRQDGVKQQGNSRENMACRETGFQPGTKGVKGFAKFGRLEKLKEALPKSLRNLFLLPAYREQLDWLKESGAADDGVADAAGGGAAGSVQWSGRSSQATTKKGWGAIGDGGSLSLKAKTEMLAAKKDSKRIRALEELVGDGTTLEEEAASGALSALLIFAPPRPRSDRHRSRAGL